MEAYLITEIDGHGRRRWLTNGLTNEWGGLDDADYFNTFDAADECARALNQDHGRHCFVIQCDGE